MKYHKIEEDKFPKDIASLKKMNMLKDQAIDELKRTINKFESERLGFFKYHDKLIKLNELGIIDNKGIQS